MLKKNLASCTMAFLGFSMMFTGCGSNGNKATSDTAVTPEQTGTPEITSTPTPTPDPTPTSTPTPTPTNEWTYHIEQNGFYNAVAEWDEEGNLLSYPTDFKSGDYIYYNDCDEYYNNFVHESNVFNGAQLVTDFDVQHSGDNSIKVTSRESDTNGFTGFALRFSEDNVLSISDFNDTACTLGFWVYYEDSYETGISNELTFAVWSNLESYKNPEEANTIQEPTEDASDEEKNLYKLIKAENEYAAKKGFSFLSSITVPIKTWTYVEIPFNIFISDLESATEPSIVIATLGESNSATITYYNPFYLDDITVTFEEEFTPPEDPVPVDAPEEN